jgi:hypothetical protein
MSNDITLLVNGNPYDGSEIKADDLLTVKFL